MSLFSIGHVWRLPPERDPRQIFPRVLRLLVLINEQGSLARVCESEQLSYRHTWGLLQEGGDLFDTPLVEMTRGKGTRLTPLGEKLIWAERLTRARLEPALQNLASEISHELGRLMDAPGSQLSIRAAHCFGMEHLCHTLQNQRLSVRTDWCEAPEALGALLDSQCDMAGFHTGTNGRMPVEQQLTDMGLKPEEHMVMVLSRRQQGLMVKAGNPRKLYALTDLLDTTVRVVQRPAGSATRALFDSLLQQESIDAAQLTCAPARERTHDAVAAAVSGDLADAGFGLEAAARRFGLDFIPLVADHYLLALDKGRLKQQQLNTLKSVMAQPAFTGEINALPGYDARQAGHIIF